MNRKNGEEIGVPSRTIFCKLVTSIINYQQPDAGWMKRRVERREGSV
jgi:hypothetical protein